jgi:hypothetical protein
MRRRRGRTLGPAGKTRLGSLIGLLLLAGGIYLGIKFIPPYWDYLSMMDPVKEAAMAASAREKEDRIRADLIAKAKRLGLDLTDENVEFIQNGNIVVVRVAWEVPVDLPRYRHTLSFRVESKSLAP